MDDHEINKNKGQPSGSFRHSSKAIPKNHCIIFYTIGICLSCFYLETQVLIHQARSFSQFSMTGGQENIKIVSITVAQNAHTKQVSSSTTAWFTTRKNW